MKLSAQQVPTRIFLCLPLAFVTALMAGCRSPYYADRGAAVGALTGAGVGAAIGSAKGDTAPGAVIGTAVGALTGALIGEGLDEVNARNQALIEERLGRRIVGAATIQDTIAMSQAGLGDDVIINYLRGNGFTGQLSAQELIRLKQEGVRDAVIGAMQQTPPVVVMPPVSSSPPVIVEEHYYGRPVPPPFIYHRHWPHSRPPHRASWGFSYHN